MAGRATAERVQLAPTRREGWPGAARAAGASRAHRVADGLWCLRLPLPYLSPAFVNCYLVELDEGWLLIDCGSDVGAGWPALEHALGLAGVASSDIRLLLCTHSPTDHAGLASVVIERSGAGYARGRGADAATDVLREPSIALHERRRSGRRAGIPEDELDGWVDNLLAGDCAHPRPRADRLLADGDRVESALGEWEVISAAGHSPSQIVLHNERHRWLVTADLAFPGAGPYLECGWTDDPYAEHLAAVARCAALPLALALPGHGRPDHAPRGRLRDARVLTERFASRALAALGSSRRSPYEVALTMLPRDADTDTCQAALSTIICVLEHFEREGRLVSHVDAAGVCRFAGRGQAPAAG